MTSIFGVETTMDNGLLIATFGAALLLKKREGGYALAGGTPADRSEAREWISLFMHEAVVGGREPGRARS